MLVGPFPFFNRVDFDAERAWIDCKVCNVEIRRRYDSSPKEVFHSFLDRGNSCGSFCVRTTCSNPDSNSPKCCPRDKPERLKREGVQSVEIGPDRDLERIRAPRIGDEVVDDEVDEEAEEVKEFLIGDGVREGILEVVCDGARNEMYEFACIFCIIFSSFSTPIVIVLAFMLRCCRREFGRDSGRSCDEDEEIIG